VTLYMLDTNTVSYMANGKSKAARARLLNLGVDEAVCLSVVTEAEVLYGLARRPEAVALKERMEWFLASIRILPWGRDEAAVYGPMRAKLESAGKVLGTMDMQIAAHAVAAGAVLVTSDKAFGFVKELKGVVNWATDLR
jgi:tRNA(fMet)-specific endonuclease VapC